jgi:hypothetical protein
MRRANAAPSQASASSESSSSSSSRRNKRRGETEMMEALVKGKVVDFLEKYQGEIRSEFPRADPFHADQPRFALDLTKEILRDAAGFPDARGGQDNLLATLKQSHKTLKKDFEDITEYKNNIIYCNLVSLMKDFR